MNIKWCLGKNPNLGIVAFLSILMIFTANLSWADSGTGASRSLPSPSLVSPTNGGGSTLAGVPVGCRHFVTGGTQQQLNDCIRAQLAGTPVGCRGLVRSGASQADINACIQSAGMPVGCRHLGSASQAEINACVQSQLAGLPVNCRGLFRSGASQADLNACVELNMAGTLRARAVANAKTRVDEAECPKDNPKDYYRCLQRRLGMEGAPTPAMTDLDPWTPSLCNSESGDVSELDRADAGCGFFSQTSDVSCRGLNNEEAWENGNCFNSETHGNGDTNFSGGGGLVN